MSNFLDIIHRLFLIKTHDVSKTGVCLRYQVKDTYSVGRNRLGVLLPDEGDRLQSPKRRVFLPKIDQTVRSWGLSLSIGPNRVGALFYLITETDSSLRNFLCFYQK
jgi:hypothetical protein